MVESPGLFTSIQDLGRKGFRNWGIPQSGAMDPSAMQMANSLVENPVESPVIEMTIKGGRFRFLEPTYVACCGATMPITINGQAVKPNSTLKIEANDLLSFGYAQEGCRTYLAIKGLPNIEPVLNSYATHTLSQMGGFKGRNLQKGDTLQWLSKEGIQRIKHIPQKYLPQWLSNQDFEKQDFEKQDFELTIIAGPEWDLLNETQKENFFRETFTLSPQSNRMGFRLTPQSFNFVHSIENIVSSATIPGIIQLPQNGQPIVLMNDGQTTGGYPRIAKVLDKELSRLAQVAIGEKVCFTFE